MRSLPMTLMALLWTVPPLQADTVVYPTGSYPADVQAVQAAVDGGGRVLLKAVNEAGEPAAFDFGPSDPDSGGLVELTGDVDIRGETLWPSRTTVGERVGSHMTTVRGGLRPYFGVDPTVKSKIRGINFEGPLFAAIFIIGSAGSEIIGNRISGVVMLADNGSTGIGFDGGNDRDGAITGRVRVVGNVIEDTIDTDPIAPTAGAITIFTTATTEVEIARNVVNNVPGQGIFVAQPRGLVRIEENVLVPGADPTGFLFGNGIVIVGGRGAVYRVKQNEIRCENPQADGILFFGFGDDRLAGAIVAPVVTKNRVVMHDSLFGGVSLYGSVSHAFVAGNEIEGNGAYALQIAEGFPDDIASDNIFLGNNVSRFTSSVADVFFGTNTRENLVVGHCRSVIDLGVDNQVTCGH